MRRVIAIITIALSLALLAGCAAKGNEAQPPEKAAAGVEAQTVQDSEETQSSQATSPKSPNLTQGEPSDLDFELSLPIEDGNMILPYGFDVQHVFSLKEYDSAILRISDGVDLEDLKSRVTPKGEGITFERLYGNNTSVSDGHYELRIDAGLLKGDKKVTIKKGLKSTEYNRVLKEDIVLDFGAPEWQVSLQRVDSDTHKELLNSSSITSPSVTVRLTFDKPADRGSVEASTKQNILGMYDYDKENMPSVPNISFEWENDRKCYVSVSDIKIDARYEINLMDAFAQNGSRILQSHSAMGYPSFPKTSTAKERRENITYYFTYCEPDKLTALSLKDGTQREVQSLGNAFGSVGPVSPNGRYVVVSPYSYSWDWLCYSYNLAVFDRETEEIRLDETAYADYLDEISVDDKGKLFLKGEKRNSETGMTLYHSKNNNQLQIKDKQGKTLKLNGLEIYSDNYWWLQNSLVIYSGIKKTESGYQSTTSVIDTKGAAVKNFSGYQLLSASPDGSMLALQKGAVIEIYDIKWTKKGELNMRTLGTKVDNEDDIPYDFRELVLLFWGRGKICVIYHKNDWSTREACALDLISGEMTALQIPYAGASFVPLCFDGEAGELLYMKNAGQMFSSYTFVD